MSPQEIAEGDRLQIGRDYASVHYIGEVSGQRGVWVGLEWDDPTRGKHNGSTAGHQYFQCLYAENAGTFVRLAKLAPSVQPRVTVLQALRLRYQGAAVDSAADSSMTLGGASARGRVLVALVGQEEVLQRQGRLEQLVKAALIDSCVSSAGPPGQLRAVVPALAELDLSGCLLPDWAALCGVLEELPQLRLLNLSATRLTLPQLLPASAAVAGGAFSGLRTLIMNRCALSWSQVLPRVAAFPALTELHVCGNSISGIQLPGATEAPQWGAQLEVLDLDDNCVAEWGAVQALAQLPALQHLSLGGNQLSEIWQQRRAPGSVGCFSGLRTLLLGDNAIESWDSVNALTSFPRLEDIRLTGNPFLGADPTHGRSEVIARVGSLAMLNSSVVQHYERRDSELQYLRGLLGEMQGLAQPEERAAWEAAHPRLHELAAKFGSMAGIAPAGAASNGAVGAAGTKGGAGSSLVASMLRLHLTYGAGGGKQPKVVAKRLPRSMTVGSLKLLAERLFKVRVARQVLALRLPGEEGLRSLGKDDTQSLAFFDVEEGSEIFISEEDTEARLRDAAAAREAQAEQLAQRMQQQLQEGDALRDLQQSEHQAQVMQLSAKTT